MYEPFYYNTCTHNSRWEFSEKDEVSFYMEERIFLNKDVATTTDMHESANLPTYPALYTPKRRQP